MARNESSNAKILERLDLWIEVREKEDLAQTPATNGKFTPTLPANHEAKIFIAHLVQIVPEPQLGDLQELSCEPS